MPKLAVLILTYNEEINIAACMDSVYFADEIVIIDSFSTDRTVILAEQKGAKVVQRAMDGGFAAQRNFALEQTDAEWVLYLDADERITEPLAKEIQVIVREDRPFAYEILRKNIVFGKPVSHGGHKPDWSRRLYRRTAIQWEGLVHEHAKVTLPLARCQEAMLHYTYISWEKYFVKFNQYTSLMAQNNRAAGKRASLSDLILRPLFGFFKMYILKGGFLDGRIGFILAVLHAIYTFTKYIKLDYLEQQAGRNGHDQ